MLLVPDELDDDAVEEPDDEPDEEDVVEDDESLDPVEAADFVAGAGELLDEEPRLSLR